MDLRPNNPIQQTPEKEKRPQKYLNFRVQPEDHALLASLPEPQRDVLLTDGIYEERARQLGIPVGTVRSRLHRARAALEALRAGHSGQTSTPLH